MTLAALMAIMNTSSKLMMVARVMAFAAGSFMRDVPPVYVPAKFLTGTLNGPKLLKGVMLMADLETEQGLMELPRVGPMANGAMSSLEGLAADRLPRKVVNGATLLLAVHLAPQRRGMQSLPGVEMVAGPVV